MIIQHNIMALNAHRQLGGNNSLVQKNLEKLSSGYKINRAGDDAAGLAISEKMRAQITGLTRAQSNAQDGISLVQTAEGALTEVHSMLNRMVDLSTQSANGTLKDDDRQKIQDEMNALTEEIDRISQSTNFNGINLLDGSLGGGLSGGGAVGGKIVSYTAAALNKSGLDATAATFATADVFVIDGVEVSVDYSNLTADEQNTLKVAWAANTDADKAKKAAAVLEKTINAAIDKTNASKNTSVNHVSVKANADSKGFTTTSGMQDNGASQITLKTSGATTGVAAKVMGLAVNDSASAASIFNGDLTKVSGLFTMTLDGEEIEVDLTAAPANPGAIAGDLQTAIRTAINNYETAKGLAANSIADKVGVTMNTKGQIEVANTSGLKIGFSDKNGGNVAEKLGLSVNGKSLSSGLTLQIGDTGDDFNKVTVSVDDMSSAGLGIAGIKVEKQGVSDAALAKVKKAINTVSTNRSAMGALQNRLEHTINNLGVASENMTAAESRIRDVDMAKEMMHFTKNNVLSQAAQAMLAQANQQPQQVLQLLR